MNVETRFGVGTPRLITVRKRLHGQGGSLTVVLPKIWIDALGLKPRDEVEIQLADNLTIIPIKDGKKQE